MDASLVLVASFVHYLLDSNARIVLKRNLRSRLGLQLFEVLLLDISKHNAGVKEMQFGEKP